MRRGKKATMVEAWGMPPRVLAFNHLTMTFYLRQRDHKKSCRKPQMLHCWSDKCCEMAKCRRESWAGIAPYKQVTCSVIKARAR